MCMIIDANVASEFTEPSSDAKPVLERIVSGRLKIVSGYQTRDELVKCAFRTLYKQFILAGRIFEFPDSDIVKEIRKVEEAGIESDDPHVIALARVSGARILFSRDLALHQDFKNPKLIKNPRGRVYQRKAHVRILDEHECSCSS